MWGCSTGASSVSYRHYFLVPNMLIPAVSVSPLYIEILKKEYTSKIIYSCNIWVYWLFSVMYVCTLGTGV